MKMNSNTKVKAKLLLKRYTLFQRDHSITDCALEKSHRPPARRGDLFHQSHFTFIVTMLSGSHMEGSISARQFW